MIYNTTKQRDRLILELQARCGLRIGELLKIRVSDVSDRTITLREPKSGKETDRAHIRENVSRKLAEYIKEMPEYPLTSRNSSPIHLFIEKQYFINPRNRFWPDKKHYFRKGDRK